MKKSNLLSKMSLLLVFMLVAAMAFGCGNKTETVTNTTGTTNESQVISSEMDTNITTDTENATDTESVANTDTENAVVAQTEITGNYTPVGEGSTVFNFEVIDGDGKTTGYEVSTDETTVGAALLALDMIAGDEGEFGLYVTSVLGQEASSDADGTPYWAFYIDGEYAPTGVDATEITPGATYTFIVETY